MTWNPNPVPINVARASIRAHAELYGVSIAQILGERRLKHLVKARLDIIEHLVIDLGYSGHSVAKAMNRDHTTIAHHLRTLRALDNPVEKLSPSFSFPLVDLAKNGANTYGCHSPETAR